MGLLNSPLIKTLSRVYLYVQKGEGLVNIKDEIGFGMCRLLGLLALEEGGGSGEAASERMVSMSNLLVT